MKTIVLIDAIHLTDIGVQAKTKNGRFQKVHLQQGELDGACAVYATFMTLILIGAVKYSEIIFGGIKYDGRYSIERLKREFFEARGFHTSGIHLEYDGINDLKGILKRNFSKLVDVAYETSNLLEIIKENIFQNTPVIIGKAYKGGGAHAVVAIGCELDQKGEMSKIYCLDPSWPAPKLTYWNLVIDLTELKGPYKYSCFTKGGYLTSIRLSDLLIIRRR